ncbi:MAG: hypothetical protein M1812_007693 [Candelaria pacifica]|nr:MAG: hypothetical protein M1812_007693 [Candelaria pacifica]
MIGFLSRPLRSLQAKLSAGQIHLPTLSLYQTNSSSESSDPLFRVGDDSDSDAANYELRSPRLPSGPGISFRVPSDMSSVEYDPSQGYDGDGIPLVDLSSRKDTAHLELDTEAGGEQITLHLGIELVRTLQDVLKGRREAGALKQKLRGAESRVNTSNYLLEMKRHDLRAHGETLDSPDVDLETLYNLKKDVEVLEREIREITQDQRDSEAEREGVALILNDNSNYQDFIEDRLFGALDDAMIDCDLLEPADDADKISDKVSTTALSPIRSKSSFVSLEELAHRFEYQKERQVNQDLIEVYRAKQDELDELRHVFERRDEQESIEKEAFRYAQANDEAGSMITEDFDVDFLKMSMQLTTDLKAAEQACFNARGEAMAHGCLHNEPDRESDFVDCSSDGYAASAMDALVAEAPRYRIEGCIDDCEREGIFRDEPRPIDDVYDTDEDDSLVLPKDSVSQAATGKRRELIDIWHQCSAAQWDPVDQ